MSWNLWSSIVFRRFNLFAPRIKEQLDTLEQFFPSERKQCEMLFGKVYDIYRECGFRHMNEPTQLGFNLYE